MNALNKWVFGTEWVSHADEIVPRGSTNLIRVAREAPKGQALRTAARTAGFLRGAGIAGGVLSSGYDVANIAAQGNMQQAFQRDRAGYVADLAKTGFDMSLTAAMVAPTPWTLGAVGVTATVYVGAQVVDHWDDIEDGAGKAADWLGDGTRQIAGATADKVGDAFNAARSSKVNPMKWFD